MLLNISLSDEARRAADGLGPEPRARAVGAAGVERDADHRHVVVGDLHLGEGGGGKDHETVVS